MSGAPITFKGQHFINLFIGLTIIFLIYYLCKTQSSDIFWAIVAISFLVGVLLIIPIGGADMPVVISMLNLFWLGCSWYWIYIRKYSFDYYRSPCWILELFFHI